MQAGEFIAFPGFALLLAVTAGSAGATSIVELSPIESGQHARTLTMHERSVGSVRCEVLGGANCAWAASQPPGAWARVSIVEVATEPSALRALLEREWMRRLEQADGDYSPTAPRDAISSTSR